MILLFYIVVVDLTKVKQFHFFFYNNDICLFFFHFGSLCHCDGFFFLFIAQCSVSLVEIVIDTQTVDDTNKAVIFNVFLWQKFAKSEERFTSEKTIAASLMLCSFSFEG